MNSAKRPILFAFITLFFVILSLNCSAQNSTAAPSPAARPAFRMPNTIVSPEILPDNKVTFRIMAPKASEISLNGDWMSGFGTVQPLIKSDTGLWMITVGPLKPEIYGYSFIIDGVSTIDPNNIQIRRDGKNYQSFLCR
jgi:1,4-alpha-glucan branching enzyme